MHLDFLDFHVHKNKFLIFCWELNLSQILTNERLLFRKISFFYAIKNYWKTAFYYKLQYNFIIQNLSVLLQCKLNKKYNTWYAKYTIILEYNLCHIIFYATQGYIIIYMNITHWLFLNSFVLFWLWAIYHHDKEENLINIMLISFDLCVNNIIL